MKKILVVDIGGTHVKLLMARREQRQFDSGPKIGPKQLARKIKETTGDWNFDAVSIGFPAPIRKGRIMRDPKHLGFGWVGFDFQKTLKKPVRIINDAAMQALGSHRGGRMLFLGLGTGLGSALIIEETLFPLESEICLIATATSSKIFLVYPGSSGWAQPNGNAKSSSPFSS